MTIGERIKAQRIAIGISQLELAHRMGLTNKSTVCKVENGGDNLNNVTIARYAKALHTTPAYLMGWTGAEQEESSTSRNASLDAELLFKLGKLSDEKKRALIKFIDSFLESPDN